MSRVKINKPRRRHRCMLCKELFDCPPCLGVLDRMDLYSFRGRIVDGHFICPECKQKCEKSGTTNFR